MKLRTKVLASFGLIMTLSLSAFGALALNSVERDAKSLLSANIQSALIEINSLEESAITASFSVSANVDFELLVGLYDSKGELLSFTETEILLKNIEKADVKAALNQSVELKEDKAYLIRTIDLNNGSFVILASGLESIEKSVAALQTQILTAIAIILVLSMLMIYAAMNKDLAAIKRLSRDADQISGGNLNAQLTEIPGKSEVANLSQSIANMAQTLQKQSKDMQQLLGDISHELKTPLTSIRGYSELLSQKLSDSEDDLRAFEILQNEIDHMTRLIDDILLMSKLGAINYDLTDDVDLGKLVKDRFSILQELQPERDLHIIDECNEKIKVSLPLITRLIDNLISNTMAHTSPNDSVSIYTFIEDGTWSLQYEDSGGGLPETYFEGQEAEFFRFDARKAEGKGTGLGLSIIQQIVQQHDGVLTLGKSYLGGLLLRITAPIVK
jgi:signal transduction histidine kinase